MRRLTDTGTLAKLLAALAPVISTIPIPPRIHPEIVLRAANTADLAALSLFAGASYRAAYCEFDDADEITAYVAENFSVERLQHLHAQSESQFLIAETATEASMQILGYAHTRLGRPQSATSAQHPMQLVRLYLDPGQKGRGIGSILMRAVIEQAKNQSCDAIWLGVYSLNRPALAFYQRWGFVQIGMTEFVFAGRSYMDPLLELTLR